MIWVRASSSYFDSLQRLNGSLRERGLDPVVIRQAEEQLETEDLLEMAASGLLGITVADDYLTDLWTEVLDDPLRNLVQFAVRVVLARDQQRRQFEPDIRFLLEILKRLKHGPQPAGTDLPIKFFRECL